VVSPKTIYVDSSIKIFVLMDCTPNIILLSNSKSGVSMEDIELLKELIEVLLEMLMNNKKKTLFYIQFSYVSASNL